MLPLVNIDPDRFAHSIEIVNVRSRRPTVDIAARYSQSFEFEALISERGRNNSVGWAWLTATPTNGLK